MDIRPVAHERAESEAPEKHADTVHRTDDGVEKGVGKPGALEEVTGRKNSAALDGGKPVKGR